MPKFIKINTSLWLVDCTLTICSGKCEVQTTSHQMMPLKDARCPPCPTHLPQGWKCICWEWTGKAIFLNTGNFHFRWPLMHNFSLMWPETLQQLSNLHNNFRFTAILHRWYMCTFFWSRWLADSDITVRPSVKCRDRLHRRYNHEAHWVYSSTALAFLHNMSDKHKSTSHGLMHVKNWWRTIRFQE